MNLLSGFSKKQVQNKMDMEMAVGKLQALASYMEANTDKPSDLKYWQENMRVLYGIELKGAPYLSLLKESYHILYKLYLRKHYPETAE